MLLERSDGEFRKPEAQAFPKLQLGLLVCGVLLLASIASMQFVMLRGFSQLAENVNSKTQGLDSLSRFGDLQEPVSDLLARGTQLLKDPTSFGTQMAFMQSLADPWSAIQLLRHGIPYLLTQEAMPGVLRLFDTLQSSAIKSNLQQVANTMSKVVCTTRFDCNRSAAEIWGGDAQTTLNEAYAWAKMILEVWPSNLAEEDQVTENKQVAEARTCNSTDVWADLVCTVEVATQHFDAADWSRTAQRCVNIAQKLAGQRYVRQSFWRYRSWMGDWVFTQPVEYTADMQDILSKIERGCRLFI